MLTGGHAARHDTNEAGEIEPAAVLGEQRIFERFGVSPDPPTVYREPYPDVVRAEHWTDGTGDVGLSQCLH